MAVGILLMIFREDHLVRRGKVPIGRLRRFWFKPDRRDCPRYHLDWPVRYVRSRVEPPVPSQMRNLSQTGVGLVVQENLKAGSSIQLELDVPNQAGPIKLSGRVIWSKEIPLGPDPRKGVRVFFIGIRFYEMSPQAEANLKKALESKGLGRTKPL